MKSRKKKAIWAWIGVICVCFMIPLAFVGKATVTGLRARVGSNKRLINDVVANGYTGQKIDGEILEASRKQVHEVLEKAEKTKGKYIGIGEADTIPSLMDLVGQGYELSYNLPVQFEKGFMTFTFRVRNEDNAQSQVIWAEVSEGIAAHDDFKSRIRNKLP